MAHNIDLDRGVVCHVHPTGMEIYMYKDTPGEYLNAHGKPVPEAVAAASGFDVMRYQKAKLRNDRMKQAMEMIDKELAEGEETAEVVETREGFKIIDVGAGGHRVEDPDGNVLTPVPVPRELAQKLVNQLLGIVDDRVEVEPIKDDVVVKGEEEDKPASPFKLPLKGKPEKATEEPKDTTQTKEKDNGSDKAS